MDRLVFQQQFRAAAELGGITLIMLLPVLQHLVHRDPFPARGVVVVDRIALAEAEDRLRVESERIRHQPVDGRHVDFLRALLGGR